MLIKKGQLYVMVHFLDNPPAITIIILLHRIIIQCVGLDIIGSQKGLDNPILLIPFLIA